MAAKTKDELHIVATKEFSKLEKLMDGLEPALAMAKRDEDTSIKDVIGHRAHWITLFLGWYADGLAGNQVYFPAKGYKWNQLKAYNANLRENQKELDWQQACTLLRANHAKLIEFIETNSDTDLYAGPMKGANNDWTPGRWAEAAGPSHYRSAAKFIRKCLKDER